MVEIDDAELERRLRAIRLGTSERLDARVKALAERLQPASTAGTSCVPRIRRRLVTRLGKLTAAVAAGCVLVAFAWGFLGKLGPMPSAYGELMEAAENSQKAEWLHAQGTVSGEDVEMWGSLRPLRSFVKRGDHVKALDAEAHRQYTYDPATNTLTIQYMPGAPPELAQNFLAVVMARLERSEKEGRVQITMSREVVGGAQHAVYTVTLIDGGQQATLTVDASTQRLVKMESQEAQGPFGPGPFEIEFDYPQTGPRDIYAAGVPRDAKVVDQLPS